MIHALVVGTLIAEPATRTSSGGKTFATAQVRVPTADDAVLMGITAWGELAEKLLALHKGDAVSITGELRPNVWVDRQGVERRSWNITAAGILSTYESRKRRAAHEVVEA
jgi:single-stranded DNA-binding protein